MLRIIDSLLSCRQAPAYRISLSASLPLVFVPSLAQVHLCLIHSRSTRSTCL